MNGLVLGAGPAGLAAGHALARRGDGAVILEKDAVVGGLSRTVEHAGYLFDVGGHRFLTRHAVVMDLWRETLPQDLLVRERRSRIWYRQRFFDYPLKPGSALVGLGPWEAARCLASFARARRRPRGGEATFEEWVSNRYGDRLFDLFFRSYTEKVWGLSTREISADWAAQRIKDLDLTEALRDALLRPLRRRADAPLTLADRFHYPRRGPGQLYARMADRFRELGGHLLSRHEALAVRWSDRGVEEVLARGPDGGEVALRADAFFSSIPLSDLVLRLDPPPPADVLRAARSLAWRHLVAVNLVVDAPDLFPDQWIYVQDAGLRLGRVQNYKNWSPDMVPDPGTTSLGLEYFCSDGDPTWILPDADLVALGLREVQAMGFRTGRLVDSLVVRAPRAYPVYRRGYAAHVDVIVRFLRRLPNLHAIGRYGMFKYNNADHSILTALLAVENAHGATHDLWAINTDSAPHPSSTTM